MMWQLLEEDAGMIHTEIVSCDGEMSLVARRPREDGRWGEVDFYSFMGSVN